MTVTEPIRVTADDFNDIPTWPQEEELHNPFHENGDTPHADSWQPINLAELDDQPPVQPTLGGIGIVYPGKRHVFSGPQESAKTLAAYAIALHIIREHQRVCVIDFEMGMWEARNRLRELGATLNELAAVIYLEPHEPATEGRIDAIIALEPVLTIVDAAAGAFDLQGLDDNKRADVERFARIYIQRFWRAGIATITLDHVVKNTEARGKYAIGSERKVGGADVHLGYEVIHPISRGSHGLYKIVTHKDRGGYLKRGKLAELELRSDPATHTITWTFRPAEHDDDKPFRPTHLMEKVSKHLGQQDEPVSKNSVYKAMGGRREYVFAALSILLAEGYAIETEKGITHVSHYLESEDKTGVVPVVPEVVPGTSAAGGSPGSPPYGGTGTATDPGTDMVVPEHSGPHDDGIPF